MPSARASTLLSMSNFSDTRDSYPPTRKKRRSISAPLFARWRARASANKGRYKTFRCNEIGDCVRRPEWINRNRLSNTSRNGGGRACEIWRRLNYNGIAKCHQTGVNCSCQTAMLRGTVEHRWRTARMEEFEFWWHERSSIARLPAELDLRAWV